MASEIEQAATVRAHLDAALGPWSAYDYDDVPEPSPSIYVLVTASRRFGAPVRMCGGRPQFGWRLTTLAVGRTADEARWARDKVFGALSDKKLTVGDLVSTPVRFETEQPIEPDDGVYSGLTSWTYAL